MKKNFYLKNEFIENFDKQDFLKKFINDFAISNTWLLECNIQNFEDLIYFFMENNADFFVLNGFIGSGKSCCIDFFIKKMLCEKVLVFKSKIFEGTSVDDIYLEFFDQFRSYFKSSRIKLPKVENISFAEKIALYFQNLDLPFVLVFDVIDKNININFQEEFFSFLFHIQKMHEKNSFFKTIICSSVFNFSIFQNNYINFENSIIKPLLQTQCDDFAKKHFSSFDFSLSKKLFEITHGHFLYFNFLKVLNLNFGFDILSLTKKFEKQTLNMLDFLSISILKELKIDDKKPFLAFLALLNTRMTTEFVLKHNLVEKEFLKKLVDCNIVTLQDGNLYVRHFLKKHILNCFSDDIKIKISKFLLDLFTKELELKPHERQLNLSRTSSRKQIEIFTSKLNSINKKTNLWGKNINLSYITYARSILPIKQENKEIKNFEYKHKEDRFINKKNTILKVKPDDNTIIDMIYEEKENSFEKILDSENNLIKNNLKDHLVEKNIPLEEKINFAMALEKNFEYEKAIKIYKSILNDFEDKENDLEKAYVNTQMGLCYKKESNYELALSYLKKASKFYEMNEEKSKLNEVLLEIARIHKDTFNFNDAKMDYIKIFQSSDDENLDLKLQSICEFCSVETNDIKIIENLKNFQFDLNKVENKALCGEFFFKLALGYDNLNDMEKALEYYNKALKFYEFDTKNKFTSICFFNIANIKHDTGDFDESVLFFKRALGIDTKFKNFEGIYASSMNLSELLFRKQPHSAFLYMKKALNCAYELENVFYIAQANLLLGDCYYEQHQDNEAIKCYLKAKKLTILNDGLKENLEKIDTRLEDLKVRLGEYEYKKLVGKFE